VRIDRRTFSGSSRVPRRARLFRVAARIARSFQLKNGVALRS
jgi:hypothetical protein